MVRGLLFTFSVTMLKNQTRIVRRRLILGCHMNSYFLGMWMIFLPFALFGCSLIAGQSKGEFAAVAEESKGKDSSGELLIPVANYSTEKGKYLGERYNRNLEHLLAQIVQDRVTR